MLISPTYYTSTCTCIHTRVIPLSFSTVKYNQNNAAFQHSYLNTWCCSTVTSNCHYYYYYCYYYRTCCGRRACAELEERARLLKQRLNIKTGAAASADGGVPFSDSEVSGAHRSRPRDGGRKSAASRSSVQAAAGVESPPTQHGSPAGTWNRMQSAERSSTSAGGGARHAAARSSSSSSYRHDYPRRSHTADVHADRTYRRRGIYHRTV